MVEHDATSDLHLSEVSLHREGASTTGTIFTTFSFPLPPANLPPLVPLESNDAMQDNEGDLILERRQLVRLNICHQGATTLQAVGMQIWPASIILADFILQEATRMKGCVIELGGGCSGLPSLVLAKIRNDSQSCPIYITDSHMQSLRCLGTNVERNGLSNVRVRQLDWISDDEIPDLASSTFGWAEEDLGQLDNEEGITLLSADCIYDESLTEAMMDVAYQLMKRSRGPAVMYVACEKRFTFTIRDLDSRAPAFDHFLSLIQVENGNVQSEEATENSSHDGSEVKKLKGRRVDISSIREVLRVEPFHTPRSMDLLELWQIELNEKSVFKG